MSEASTPTLDEELRMLDLKIKQLKLDYDRYFLGTRPREPSMARAEVDKTFAALTSQPIQNTALRFKFSSLCARFQVLKRQWSETLRKIEDGSYARHRFKADLAARMQTAPSPPRARASEPEDLFAAYRDARLACGQDVQSLTRERLDRMLGDQREALQRRYGDAPFRFKVVVEHGKAKLKATRVRGAG